MLKYLFVFSLIALASIDSSATEGTIELSANQVGSSIQASGGAQSEWRFSVVPIFWLPPVTGEFNEAGMTLEFEASQSDRLNNINLGGELMLEFTNGKWTFVFQPQSADVEMSGTLKTPYGDIPAELRSESISIDFWGARRFNGQRGWVEVLIGGRAFSMEVKTKTIMGEGTKNVDWYDPLIGVRGQFQITDQWEAEGMINTSGFDLSDSTSENTLETRLGLNFLTKKNWKFMVGYRTFDVTNKENESKGTQEKIKMKLKGPYVGVGYKFK